MKRVAVIGAGAAGLCSARHLCKYPEAFSVRVFEQNAVLGGAWVYTDQTDPYKCDRPVHSGMYDALSTNLPKAIMQFTDFGFDAHLPSFMSHRDVLGYLQKYAEHYNLLRHIAFHTIVEKVTPLALTERVGSTRWRVQTRDVSTSHQTCEDFDYVVVCNGHYSKPYLPPIPGLDTFPGHVMHSHQYREPSLLRNKAVLIVGDGFSGIDIMLDVASVARTVYLSNSHKPLDCSLPTNVTQVSRVAEVEGNVACTVEGRLEVDCVVLCTGYLYHAPFLGEDCGVEVDDRRVHPCYHHTFNALHPSMAFIGLNVRIIPFPCFDLQVQWVLAVWRGEKHLPSRDDMVRHCHHDYRQRLERGMPPHYAHYMGDLQWDFYEQLGAMGGVPPLPHTIKKVYDIVAHRRVRDIQTYRNELNSEPPW